MFRPPFETLMADRQFIHQSMLHLSRRQPQKTTESNKSPTTTASRPMFALNAGQNDRRTSPTGVIPRRRKWIDSLQNPKATKVLQIRPIIQNPLQNQRTLKAKERSHSSVHEIPAPKSSQIPKPLLRPSGHPAHQMLPAISLSERPRTPSKHLQTNHDFIRPSVQCWKPLANSDAAFTAFEPGLEWTCHFKTPTQQSKAAFAKEQVLDGDGEARPGPGWDAWPVGAFSWAELIAWRVSKAFPRREWSAPDGCWDAWVTTQTLEPEAPKRGPFEFGISKQTVNPEDFPAPRISRNTECWFTPAAPISFWRTRRVCLVNNRIGNQTWLASKKLQE